MLDKLFGSAKLHAFYNTRPDAHGVVTTHRVGRVWLALTMLVLQANVLGWGLFGLYALGDQVI